MYGIYKLTENQKRLQQEIIWLIERVTVPQIPDTEPFTLQDLEAEAEILAVTFAN